MKLINFHIIKSTNIPEKFTFSYLVVVYLQHNAIMIKHAYESLVLPQNTL